MENSGRVSANFLSSWFRNGAGPPSACAGAIVCCAILTELMLGTAPSAVHWTTQDYASAIPRVNLLHNVLEMCRMLTCACELPHITHIEKCPLPTLRVWKCPLPTAQRLCL